MDSEIGEKNEKGKQGQSRDSKIIIKNQQEIYKKAPKKIENIYSLEYNSNMKLISDSKNE